MPVFELRVVQRIEAVSESAARQAWIDGDVDGEWLVDVAVVEEVPQFVCERCGMRAHTDDLSIIGRNCWGAHFGRPHVMREVEVEVEEVGDGGRCHVASSEVLAAVEAAELPAGTSVGWAEGVEPWGVAVEFVDGVVMILEPWRSEPGRVLVSWYWPGVWQDGGAPLRDELVSGVERAVRLVVERPALVR